MTYSRGRGRSLCIHCGKTNHSVDRCFYIHGFPPGFGRGRGKLLPSNSYQLKSINCVEEFTPDSLNDLVVPQSTPSMPTMDQCQQLITLLQSQLSNTSTSAPPQDVPTSTNPFSGIVTLTPLISTVSSHSNTSIWLLDTGATHHVCCDINLFTTSHPVNKASVNLPNGNTAIVSHIGTIHLTDHITLSSVLCVPSFSYNLIFVSSLTKKSNCFVTFTHDTFEIQVATMGTVIGKGNRLGNLYTLTIPDQPHTSPSSNHTQSHNLPPSDPALTLLSV